MVTNNKVLQGNAAKFDANAFHQSDMKRFEENDENKKKNGEVHSFLLNAPMDYKFFKNLSIVSQKDYIKYLREYFDVTLEMLAGMFGCHRTTIQPYLKNTLGITFPRGHFCTSKEKINRWITFLNGEFAMNKELKEQQISLENKQKLKNYINELNEKLNGKSIKKSKKKIDKPIENNSNITIINDKRYYVTKFGKVIPIEDDNNNDYVKIVEDNHIETFNDEETVPEVIKNDFDEQLNTINSNYSSSGSIVLKGNINEIYSSILSLKELLNKNDVNIKVEISW